MADWALIKFTDSNRSSQDGRKKPPQYGGDRIIGIIKFKKISGEHHTNIFFIDV